MYNLNMTKKKVLLYGVFDNFHSGHCNIINFAASKGELIVAVFSDKSVLDSKSRKTDWNENFRAKNISLMDNVSMVEIVENMSDISKLCKKYSISLAVLGDDHDNEWIKKFYKNNNVELIIKKRTKEISSTLIRGKKI